MKKGILLIIALLVSMQSFSKGPKMATSACFVMEKESSRTKQNNDSITITYRVVHKLFGRPFPIVIMTVRNESSRTIYVDLQNSFFIPNSEALPMYINKTEVNTTGNTSGGGVSLGIIGGGSATSEYNTKITSEERILIIPDGTKKEVSFPIERWEKSWQFRDGWIGFLFVPEKGTVRQHMELRQNFIPRYSVLTYSYDDSPMVLDLRVSYSYNSDLSNLNTDKSVYYAKYIVGSHWYPAGVPTLDFDYNKIHELFPSWESYLDVEGKLLFHLWN